jgi:hypothetical protein
MTSLSYSSQNSKRRDAGAGGTYSAKTLATRLDWRKAEVLTHLFPAGRFKGHEFCVGNLAGEPGDSLRVHLNGKGSVWADFTTGAKGGDLLDLWAQARCSGSISQAMREVAAWLGLDRHPAQPEGTWIYHDAEGVPWIRVERLPTTEGKKRFRQYDYKAQKWITSGGHSLPEPRPLYRLPEILASTDVIFLVEGEKCADALAGLGFAATTTIGGANAPHKTDFQPLAEKYVYNWPDNDPAGKTYADTVAQECLRVAALPHRIPIPEGKPKAWDAADAVAEGWTREDVLALLNKATLIEEKKALKAITFEELTTREIKPRESLLTPVIYQQSLLMVYAMKGVGKTLFSLGIADALRTSGTFLDWRAPKPRKVLYVDGELPEGMLQQRMHEMAQSLPPDVPAGLLKFITPDEQDGPMPDLATEEGQRAIEEHLDGIDLLILDNLSTLIKSGEENVAESWQPFQEWLLRLRRLGLSVLLDHHAGKSGTQRGTSKRIDTLDNVIRLALPPDYVFEDGARFEVRFDNWRGDRTGVHEVEARYEVIGGRGLWTWKACTDAMTDKVVSLLTEGLTQREVAQTLKVGVATVNRHKQKAERAGKLKN